MSEVRKFKTESKRLLDLMINSIYTNKEIFLRELISNASDAIDKYHYLSLTNKDIPAQDSYHIHLSINKDDRILTIEDNGIGMTYEEVINNLGTIAKSGSLEFLNNLKEEQAKDIDIIGQFGVGFYSAFMVSDKVVVETKSPLSEKGYRFTSKGTEKYEIEEIDKPQVGTKIDIYLRKSTEEEDYEQFLDDYHIQSLVKKYSDYVRYPITMEVEKSVPEVDKDGKEIENKYKTIHETITLNSMVPIWKKSKNDVSEKDLNEFYKQKFADGKSILLEGHAGRAEDMNANIGGALITNKIAYIFRIAPEQESLNKLKEHLTQKIDELKLQCDKILGFVCGGWALNKNNPVAEKSFDVYNTIANKFEEKDVPFGMICGKTEGKHYDNLRIRNNRIFFWSDLTRDKLNNDEIKTSDDLITNLEKSYDYVEISPEFEIELTNLEQKVPETLG